MLRRWLAGLIILLWAHIALASSPHANQPGATNTGRYASTPPSSAIDYWHDVNPLLEKRCVVCHACYDAPCQLKLGSSEGIRRGANKAFVYNGERLLAASPTRLFEDAHSTAEWRNKEFFPVLNESADSRDNNIDNSLLAQMLLLKNENPLPANVILPDSFDFKLTRNQQCSTIEEFGDFRKKYPLWGMPYGLPGLKDSERNLLLQWVKDGAPYQARDLVPPTLKPQIEQWEAFFNQDSLKAQLMSRYMYEHLFLAHLYFEANDRPVFFQLIRSRTAPGQPIDRITTLRPFDDPKVKRVYYRILPVQETIVVKTHMPYLLNEQRMQRWHALFLQPDYIVKKLPGYAPEQASNPFITFDALPARARYRFMLEEAQFTIMGFIKGPVCRGQLALNVINDHFWIAFTDPELTPDHMNSEFISNALKELSLPAEAASNSSPLRWLRYADEEKDYLRAKSKFLKQQSAPLDMHMVWDGDGHNPNAALTVFRHYDSASVEKGFLGDHPQTAWIVSYPLLERIHYLLVAGYDVFGNVGHQLNSRIYMDFLRMEGEFNFLTLLPRKAREPVRKQWYRGLVNPVKEYIYNRGNTFDGETNEPYQTNDYLKELYGKLRSRLTQVQDHQHDLNHGFVAQRTLHTLENISNIRGKAAAFLPQTLLIELTRNEPQQRYYYTLLHNNAYTNISEIFGEEDRRLPNEDSVFVSYGVIGAYPSIFLSLDEKQLPQLAKQLRTLKSEADYQQLLNRYGIRRSNPDFWYFSDRLHQDYFLRNPISAGWLDYNRLENR